MPINEIIAKKYSEIEYLKAELELIKKNLELQESRVINNKLPWAYIFNLINNLTRTFKLKNMVSHLCKVANIPTSGYSKFLNYFNSRKNMKKMTLSQKKLYSKHLIIVNIKRL